MGAYDNKTSGVMQYVDNYYAGYGGKVAGGLIHRGGEWRDYRAVVLAFARTDADPLTPDPARGIASIQLLFRDWIEAVIPVYTSELEIKKDIRDYRERIGLRFTEEYFSSYRNVTKEIEDIVKDDRGLLGRVRDYQVVHEALDGIAPDKDQAIVDRVRTTVQRAVALQQTVEPAMAMTKVAGEKTALTALADSMHEANVDVIAAVEGVEELGGQFADVQTRVVQAEQTITSLDTRVQGTSRATRVDRRRRRGRHPEGQRRRGPLRRRRAQGVPRAQGHGARRQDDQGPPPAAFVTELLFTPETVPPAAAVTVLAFLNSVTTPEEVATGIELPEELDIGLRMGRRLLDRRAQLGGFRTLAQVAEVPLVGPIRFDQIVRALTGLRASPPVDELFEEIRRLQGGGRLAPGRAGGARRGGAGPLPGPARDRARAGHGCRWGAAARRRGRR